MEDGQKNTFPGYRPNHGRGKVIGGAIVVAIGVLLLLRQLGVMLPEWLMSWEMLLIVMGFYTGIKHRFQHPIWIVLILIGGLFLVDDFYPDTAISSMIWPVVIIFFGLVIIFKPRRKCDERNWKRWEHKWKDKWEWENNTHQSENDNDMIETVSVFGGVRKHVISKNFKGGEITCVFGGAEINLMQADFTGTAVLEVTQIFGGTKLVVPSHWEIQSHDLVAVMGGIDDKRRMHTEINAGAEKILVLRGTCIMGGIEIKAY